MKINVKKATKPTKAKSDSDENSDEQELEVDDKNITDIVKNYLAKNGTPEAGVERIMRENFRLREKLRRSNVTIADLEENAVEEGGAILTKDEAIEYAAFKELGKPTEVKTKLDEHTTLHGRVAEQERNQTIDAAAKALKWNPNALRILVKQANVQIALRQIANPDGSDTKVDQPYVIATDPNDPNKRIETNLDEFAKANEAFQAFQTSLLQSNGDHSEDQRTDKSQDSFQQIPASRSKSQPANTEAQAAHKQTRASFKRFDKQE